MRVMVAGRSRGRVSGPVSGPVLRAGPRDDDTDGTPTPIGPAVVSPEHDSYAEDQPEEGEPQHAPTTRPGARHARDGAGAAAVSRNS